ncbi:MAG TPA: hypothetical protein VFH95_15140 [Candidatus Kapabacteria bacterium]|nr:hypothetical protein [Candidatus Kapabacteria bacterium]
MIFRSQKVEVPLRPTRDARGADAGDREEYIQKWDEERDNAGRADAKFKLMTGSSQAIGESYPFDETETFRFVQLVISSGLTLLHLAKAMK